eukprot:4737729-Pyramimonas_sp.AAC.1
MTCGTGELIYGNGNFSGARWELQRDEVADLMTISKYECQAAGKTDCWPHLWCSWRRSHPAHFSSAVARL